MQVSIITPSFNQASFLEQTILSVLDQSYSPIEYIVIDGGSTDGSIDILQKYSSKFAYWQSQKDRGQADAVHQGFQRAHGDILHYLNSDDLLRRDAVQRAVELFHEHPNAGLIYGKARFINADGKYIQDYPSREFDIREVFKTWENPIPQPSAFLRKELFEKYGGPHEAWTFCADFEYWIRLAEENKFIYAPEYFSSMRLHAEAKTSRIEHIHAEELIRLCHQLMETDRIRKSGVDPKESLQNVYLRASLLFRHSGERQKALQTYFRYCWSAFAPPLALYRFCRYLGSMLLRRW